MSEDQNVPSGDDHAAAGGEQGNGNKGSVAYETHRKLLGELKATKEKFGELSSRLTAIEAEKAKAEEAILHSKGEFKTLVEIRDRKLEEQTRQMQELQQKLAEREKVLSDSRKFQAFQAKLPASLKRPEYATFIDFDSIVTDENGKVDELALEKVVSDFVKTHGDTLLEKTQTKMPNAAANGQAMTYQEQLRKAKTTAELHAVMRAHGRLN